MLINQVSEGRFGWIRRMGEHEYYHQDFRNRWTHWLCIPVELLIIIKILSILSFWSIGSVKIDFALVAIALLAPFYLLTEFLMGSAMVLALLYLYHCATLLIFDSNTAVVFYIILFAIVFSLQTKLGHGRFEIDGRDDTERNLAEVRKTWNPLPLFLIFYYHLVEVFFALGYRPKLQATMRGFRDHHAATF